MDEVRLCHGVDAVLQHDHGAHLFIGKEKVIRPEVDALRHATWQSQGAYDKLEMEIWDIPHSCPVKAQERVLEFFQKHL